MQAFELLNLGEDLRVLEWIKSDFSIVGSKGEIEFTHYAGDQNSFVYRVRHKVHNNSRHELNACFELNPTNWSWFGGPSQDRQHWPIEKLNLNDYAYLSKQDDHCSVAERYWLNSAGSFIYIPETLPLFVSQNVNGSTICFQTKDAHPYAVDDVTLEYYIGVGPNARDAHLTAVNKYLGKPYAKPDERMVRFPIWSTWARYKVDVNESAVLQLADDIERHGFEHSQIEIDDNWEECYGTLSFDKTKFPDISELTQTLRSRGFRTTLWIHPFINKNCEAIYADAKNYS